MAAWQQSSMDGRFPSTIAIELTNYCNSKCIFCPLFHGPESMDRQLRPKKFMDMALFSKISREIVAQRWQPQTIYLNLHGEPLLDPLFAQRLQLLFELSLTQYVDLQTNASPLDADTARAIVVAGVRRVTIGFDGATPETYKAHRRGCDYTQVLSNIRQLAAFRDESKSPLRIAIQYVRTHRNGTEVLAAYALFKEFLSPDLDCFQCTVSNNWARGSLVNEGVVLFGDSDTVPTQACPNVFSQLMISADGRVPACCWDYNFEAFQGPLGDVTVESLPGVWFGKKFETLRAVFESMDIAKMSALCKRCPRTKKDMVPEALRAMEQELLQSLPRDAIAFSPSGLTLYFGS
jgi:sulfatase maturation enzyme AslB (radical SAM superfamily)